MLIRSLYQIVKPYQLWSSNHITLFHVSYYCLTTAWCFLLGVHLEEFLFWSWLLQVIRTQQSKSWFKSVYFKLWCLGCVAGVGLLFGAATMELHALTRVSRKSIAPRAGQVIYTSVGHYDQIETNIFFAGSIASLL